MRSTIAIALVTFVLSATACGAQSTKSDATQQENDFEQKQRIYGTKHPWENTAPYGTQYTPPQAGVGAGSSDDSSGSSSSASEAKPATKPAPKSKARKKSTNHKKKTTKTTAGKSKAAASKSK